MKQIFFIALSLCVMADHALAVLPSPTTEQPRQNINYDLLDNLIADFLAGQSPLDRNIILRSINQIHPSSRITVLEKVKKRTGGQNAKEIAAMIDQEGKNA